MVFQADRRRKKGIYREKEHGWTGIPLTYNISIAKERTMFFKFTGQAFLIPAGIFALGFFIMYAVTRMDNRIENKGIKLYAFFTVSLLWVSAVFLLLGGILDTSVAGPHPAELEIPIPPHSGAMPPPGPADVPNGDEEMTVNPDDSPEGLRPKRDLEASRSCPYLHSHGKGYRQYPPIPRVEKI
jgi:hypothetical protein